VRGQNLVAAILSVLLTTTAFSRADFSITSHPSDFESRVSLTPTGSSGDYDPSNSVSNTSLRIGVAGGATNRVYANGVFFFKLPILQSNETITAANFRVTELADPANGPPAINADLWAVGYDNRNLPGDGPAESQAYFFNGPADPNPGVGAGTTRALLQDNFLTPADVIGTGGASVSHDTNPAGDAAILAYLQALYANPAVIPGATSVILRLNYDDAAYAPTFGTTVNHYTLAASENAANKPTLTLTTQQIPEPHSLALLAAAFLFSKRRRPRLSSPPP
jgi:hypothetical protein